MKSGRGSFYARRSASLPSMGERKGQSIIAAMGALRVNSGDDEDADDADPAEDS